MKSKSRRQAREAALQALYTLEIGRGRLAETIRQTLDHTGLEGAHAEFAKALIGGVFEKQVALDEALEPLVTEWQYDRIAVVDRNVLRMAAYELFYCPDIPPISTIDEAIELAKKFSTAESGKFVNGVLGKLLPLSPKASWDPAEHTHVGAEIEEEPNEDEAVEDVEPPTADAGLWKLRTPEEPR